MRPVIIADNQDITCLGLASLLGEAGGGTCVAVVRTRAELMKGLGEHPGAVVILDYTLFDFSGPHEMLNIQHRYPASSWLLFSDELGECLLRQVLFSGEAFGVVLKGDPHAEILRALEETIGGRRYLSAALRQIFDSDPCEPAPKSLLTPAEESILREIALGKTTKEIAFDKNLSFHTVNAHRRNIFRKLEVNNVHEAIRYALRAGIADPAEYYI